MKKQITSVTCIHFQFAQIAILSTILAGRFHLLSENSSIDAKGQVQYVVLIAEYPRIFFFDDSSSGHDSLNLPDS